MEEKDGETDLELASSRLHTAINKLSNSASEEGAFTDDSTLLEAAYRLGMLDIKVELLRLRGKK